jgi:hypothetical protein
MESRKESNKLDFAKLGGPVYVGRANGMKARERFHIAELDETDSRVSVSVPSETYSINSSYFLGLFGPSVLRFGSAEAFFGHYEFHAAPNVRATIERHVERALRDRGILELE